MLVDMRIYTWYPGKLVMALPILEKEVVPLQEKHLGRLLGYFTTESGPQNQTIQLWGFENAADREARRASLAADPEWQAIGVRLIDWVQTQENRLLKPTEFSPIR